MRTTNHAARGNPLAALLILSMVISLSIAVGASQSVVVSQTVEWQEADDGGRIAPPNLAELTLRVLGVGPTDGYPLDCVLVMDVSATSDLSTAKSFAFDLIDEFSGEDRFALVSYSSTARLDVQLTSSRTELKSAIGDLTTGGKSALGMAMQMARRELLQAGREDSVLAMILLSDGQSNVGIDPIVEGEIAAEAGIRIISIGIGTLINRTLMQEYAADTDGLFFPRPTVAALSEIDRHLDVDVVAKDVRIDKRLPAGVRLLSAHPMAAEIDTLSDGTMSIVWRAAELAVGQEIEITLEVEATDPDAWETELDSVVTYTDFREVEGSVLVPAPNWPPTAAFGFDPELITTSDVVAFEDRSTDLNDDGEIVAWLWDFGDGMTSGDSDPEHRYADRGEFTVRLVVIDEWGAASVGYERTVTVGNAPPSAGFVLRDAETLAELEQPHLGVEILLDASLSYDLDGDIDQYGWDFDGDGVIDLVTDSSDTTYAFPEPGESEVSLYVMDDEGSGDSVSKTFDILPSVAAVRTIETGLPDDWTIPGAFVYVTLHLSVNTTLNGLSVTETIPDGWTLIRSARGAEPQEGEITSDDGATFNRNGDNDEILEWLFLDKFTVDGIDSQREIRYTLRAPAVGSTDTPGGIAGFVGSSSPRVNLAMAGEDRVTMAEVLPVVVVISRWDVDAEMVDPFLGETVGFDQVQYAVALWQSDPVAEVPNSGGEEMTLALMQDLIAYWLTGSSVHDPLP